jgi:1-deoxy-D-xylulose-5-phosphate reductoisomerase
MKQISILGSTGSIGVSTLDVIKRHPQRFKLVGLAAGSNVDLLAEQIRNFSPKKVSVRSTEDKKALQERCASWDGDILVGEEGAVEVATGSNADQVVSAIVGAAGLVPTYKSLDAGIDVALANKESLVIAGKVMTEAAKRNNAAILPIDSEHSAIFQALAGNDRKSVRRIGLTASGGPFRETPIELFESVTVEQALKHPNWSMGDKITIDSATMMNKGLELVEATWLFNYPADMIEIQVHPQSIIHSMVEYIDGSVMAQMGVPDMRCAIAYALSYPERVETGVAPLNLFDVRELTFFEPDLEKFPTLTLAREAATRGETYCAVLNAANEVAVEAFLNRRIKFADIFRLIDFTFNQHKPSVIESIDDVLIADQWAREETRSALARVAA